MDLSDRKALKQEAAQRLQAATYDPRKLVLIHTAIALGASALVSIVNYFVSGQIEGTGGLAGMGSRGILTTIQAVLQLGVNIAMPFWQMGLFFVMLHLIRRQTVRPMDLREGFFRFGPVLRLQILRLLMYLAVGILSLNVGVTLFLMTPLADPMNQLLTQLNEEMANNASFVMDEATAMAVMETVFPALVLVGILYAVLLIPLLYRFRMAEYAMMDQDKPGAAAAMHVSFRLLKGNCLQLFRLDLSFWWFYLIQVLILVVSNAHILLPMLEISLPVSQDVLCFVGYGVFFLGQLGLFWRAGAQVEGTYALAYDQLRSARYPMHREKPQTPPQTPWGAWK